MFLVCFLDVFRSFLAHFQHVLSMFLVCFLNGVLEKGVGGTNQRLKKSTIYDNLDGKIVSDYYKRRERGLIRYDPQKSPARFKLRERCRFRISLRPR
jgi:hypothetical protein